MTAWIVLTGEARGAAAAASDTPGSGGVAIDPRRIDNPMAGMPPGSFALDAGLLENADYARWAAMLAGLPRIGAEAADLFAIPADPAA